MRHHKRSRRVVLLRLRLRLNPLNRMYNPNQLPQKVCILFLLPSFDHLTNLYASSCPKEPTNIPRNRTRIQLPLHPHNLASSRRQRLSRNRQPPRWDLDIEDPKGGGTEFCENQCAVNYVGETVITRTRSSCLFLFIYPVVLNVDATVLSPRM